MAKCVVSEKRRAGVSPKIAEKVRKTALFFRKERFLRVSLTKKMQTQSRCAATVSLLFTAIIKKTDNKRRQRIQRGVIHCPPG